MVPVGAMLVGKIVNIYDANKKYEKGDETGYFEFGGSTIVLLFKKNTIEVNQKFVENSLNNFETQVKIGTSDSEKI